MEVGAAEAERADRSAPRVCGAADPRPRPGVEVEGAVFEVQLGIGSGDFQGLVMEIHGHLVVSSSDCAYARPASHKEVFSLVTLVPKSTCQRKRLSKK